MVAGVVEHSGGGGKWIAVPEGSLVYLENSRTAWSQNKQIKKKVLNGAICD